MKIQVMKATKIKIKTRQGKPSVNERNTLATFITIEENDKKLDLNPVVKALIRKHKKFDTNNITVIPYAHMSRKLSSPTEALEMLLRIRENISTKGIPVSMDEFGIDKSIELYVEFGNTVNYLEF